MKPTYWVGRVATVASAVVLVAGYVAYQAGCTPNPYSRGRHERAPQTSPTTSESGAITDAKAIAQPRAVPQKGDIEPEPTAGSELPVDWADPRLLPSSKSGAVFHEEQRSMPNASKPNMLPGSKSHHVFGPEEMTPSEDETSVAPTTRAVPANQSR